MTNMIFESGADGGDTSQDNPAASLFHQVHTPRQEQDTSKLDGDQDCERNAKRTAFPGSVFSGSHGEGTPKFVQDQGSARVVRRNSFSGRESSTRRQSSLFEQDTSGHLATVLSQVRAAFPKLDFESEQSTAGAAESWMQLMGLMMSAVSREVAGFWEFTEREVRGKYEMCLRTPPMARVRVQASALPEPRFQPFYDVSDPLFLTLFRRKCRKWQ